MQQTQDKWPLIEMMACWDSLVLFLECCIFFLAGKEVDKVELKVLGA